MRRWLHCVVVALLCLTLCIDSARACWPLRCRSHSCPPVHRVPPPRSVWDGPTCYGYPAAWPHASLARDGVGSEIVACDHGFPTACHAGAITIVWAEGLVAADVPPSTQCCVPCGGSSHAVVEEVVVAGEPVHAGGLPDHDQATTQRTAPGDAVVVHAPTIVLGNAPAGAADRVPQTARPATPQQQEAPQEPLPELRPAAAAAPKDQPVPASLDMPAEPTTPSQADAAKKPAAEGLPQPTPDSPAEKMALPAAPAVEDLAVQPRVPAPTIEMPEENLFDEFAEDAMDEDAAEPTDEPEMTEERTGDEEDADAAPAAKDAPKKDASEKDASEKDAPTEDGDATGAVETTASTLVPDEPLRRWTDATGDHHAQGWLVEIRADEARILKVTGRHTTMALADLSDDDQAYVAAVAARLAENRRAAATDTAGL